jgi:phosphoribosylglycinamide formyltransferase-1
MRCAVFASGGGSNFQALIDRRDAGDLHCDLALLVGNNSGARAFERARAHDIPACHCAPSAFADPRDYAARLGAVLDDYGIELIALAGYMKMIPVEIVRRFHNRIVNIHPALLPAFGGKGMYGERVHQAVLEYGAKVSGVTVHFVDERYDTGPVILQRTVPVRDEDDAARLAARVLALEHDSYWRAIEAIARGNITVEGRRVRGEA